MKDPIDVPGKVATRQHFVITDLGCRISFGEITAEGETNYHTSIFIPLATLAAFEGQYKEAVTKWMEAKEKEKKACSLVKPSKRSQRSRRKS